MQLGSTTHARTERTLLTDGGQAQAEAEEAETDDEQPEEDETADEQVDEDESASEADDEAGDAPEEETATNILYLDLEGLSLDLLGLEVDLDEVELEAEAVTGEGNLLGNLLSAVAGLLDAGGGGLRQLLGRVLGIGFGGDGPSILERIGDGIRSSLRDAIDDIPVEKLLTQLLTGLVNQLLERVETPEGDSSDASEETAEAEA